MFDDLFQVNGTLAQPWLAVFEGEGGSTGTDTVVGGGGTDTTVAGGGSDTLPAAGGGTSKVFTQDDVNRMLAKEKGSWQKRVDDQVKMMEKLQKSQGLSEKDKGELQVRIEELQNSLLSKEELAKKDKERMTKEWQDKEKNISSERDTWRSRYTQASITRSIQDEAIRMEAYAPEQLVGLLSPSTRLVEALDGNGQPSGEFIPTVKFQDEKDGKPTTLDLTVAEAVKRMKELPERFGNLFKGTASGGLGGGRNPGGGAGGTGKDPSHMSPQEYRAYRIKENLAPGRKINAAAK